MEIIFQYFDDCPNWRLAHDRLGEVLEGRDDVEVIMELVTSPESAEAVGFRGSPTIVIDGVDPFDHGDLPPAGTLACRVYQSADGAPTLDQLRAAIGET